MTFHFSILSKDLPLVHSWLILRFPWCFLSLKYSFNRHSFLQILILILIIALNIHHHSFISSYLISTLLTPFKASFFLSSLPFSTSYFFTLKPSDDPTSKIYVIASAFHSIFLIFWIFWFFYLFLYSAMTNFF